MTELAQTLTEQAANGMLDNQNDVEDDFLDSDDEDDFINSDSNEEEKDTAQGMQSKTLADNLNMVPQTFTKMGDDLIS
eukprot:CAMPEP_0114580078 /NCGR_PEP_ID=MMETSP0125-20121206/4411_1 /TAXON_ID=485358 ORGANISM="Aristerostoma sp., Strain ATCC 50986" /NCGR_SAMPLE_ID=MMETSP0125 /ASSEMBLY_ACC=CAM_ASM_000245 /LENGTH=77 /DNA_ID=CAMNT_0001771375 /DNA_START=262 /DNA_END=495 /DNA_ORIENTATION=-